MSFPFKKMLVYRLPTWKNKEFWQWCSSQRIEGYEWHHLLGRKHSDLLLVNIPKEQHDRIHSTGYESGEFEELILQALINILRFIDEKTTT